MKVKILVFIDWFLPGFKAGGPVTSVNNLVEQFRNDFDFYILTSNHDYGEKVVYGQVAHDEWVDRSENLRVYYASEKKSSWKKLKDIALAVDAKVWYITGVYSWDYAIQPAIFGTKNTSIRTVIAPRGMLSPHALKVKSFKKSLFLRTITTLRAFRGVVFQATNEQEKQDIVRIFPDNEILLAANLPKPLFKKVPTQKIKVPGEINLISLGRIAPEKNTLGAVNALKLFAESTYYSEEQVIKLNIFGQVYSRNYWEECLAIIDLLPSNIRVEYMGTISPELLPEVFTKAHFLFLPSEGENYGHAIIESLTFGCPVIIGDQTPWTGLVEKNIGWEIPIDNLRGMTDILSTCVEMDQEEYALKSKSSFNYAQTVLRNMDAVEAHKRIFTG